MKTNKLHFVIFLSFILFQQSMASHSRGGEITARQISGLQYEITLNFYRDAASGNAVEPAAFYVAVNPAPGQTGLGNFSVTLIKGANNASQTNPINLGNNILLWKYVGNAFFPGDGVYNLTSELCCRNNDIFNLGVPVSAMYNMVFSSQITIGSTYQNSSPVFAMPASLLVPQNTLFTYSSLSIDADGDSLVYSLSTPYLSQSPIAPFSGYLAPHIYSNSSGFFDVGSGMYAWQTNVPLGKYQMAVTVSEYRSGVKIGEIRRDIQFVVIPNAANLNPPQISLGGNGQYMGNNTFHLPVELNVPSGFTLNFTDADNNQLDVSLSGAVFQLANNPATFTTAGGIGSASASILWTPNASQATTQNYPVLLRLSETLPSIPPNAPGILSTDFSLNLSFNTVQSLVLPAETVNFSMFPNPASGEVILSFESGINEEGNIMVLDLAGKVMSERILKTYPGINLIRYDLSSVLPGSYFLRIQNGKNISIQKLIVE